MSSPAAAGILSRTINATRFIYFLYQLVQLASLPAAALYLLYRGIRDPGYRRHFWERLGFLSDCFETTGPSSIWFHAVSVGEVLSVEALLRELGPQMPGMRMYVSTATVAGREVAEKRLAGLVSGVFFAPLDYRSVVRRVLRKLRPALVVVMETEIWPNLYRESKRAGAALMVANGRISDRALPRYRRWRGFFRHVLCWPDAILVQSEQDREKFLAAGAPRQSVKIAGNLKYDFRPPSDGVAPEIVEFLGQARPSQIWIAASTMPPFEGGANDVDEDDAVIAAFDEVRARRNGVLLILAPRRPERFDAVEEKLKRAGVPFVRRTRLPAPASLPGALLLDSVGELAALFARADVVFMGGTLARRGGHNILEPAYFGKPVIVGPHMENFAAIVSEFREAGAVAGIERAGALGDAVAGFLGDAARRALVGERARRLAMSGRGVAARTSEEIRRACAKGVPDPPRTLIARLALTPLSRVWRAMHQVQMQRALSARRSLTTPVISIGGLAMGGTGKSPMAAHLAARLRESGRDPAILIRGYKRRSAQQLVISRGEAAAPAVTGDEAQILIRAGDAHVGIGADRFALGSRIERELEPDVFLLDDGFQHVQLDRNHDIVLIDALDPLGGGVFPLGRLREPVQNLQRATILVITRVEAGQDVGGLECLLRRCNSKAPIFRARVVPQCWIDLESGTARDLSQPGFRKAVAFCGLGAPRSFWRTLEQLGIEAVDRRAFRDHHRYRPDELRQLGARAEAARAGALVTTEKDVMNLPEGAQTMAGRCPILWLKIGIEIDNEAELLERIVS